MAVNRQKDRAQSKIRKRDWMRIVEEVSEYDSDYDDDLFKRDDEAAGA